MSARKRRRTSAPSGQFDLVVVGCGGGHDETNLSGYLCKPRDQPWDAGILGLEAGSGYGALKRLLGTTHPRLFSSLFPPKSKLTPTDRAHAVYTHLRAFLLTHAHLDHAASLIISAGSLPGPTKCILGAQGVLDDLNRCIFTPGRCWPNIVGWDGNTSGGKLRALPVADGKPIPGNDGKPPSENNSRGKDNKDEEYTDLGVGMDNVRVRVVPLAHGGSCSGSPHPTDEHHDDEPGVYRSSAFFLQHIPTRHEFLFFGDVETDPSYPPSPNLSPALAPNSPPASCPDNDATPPPACRPLLLPVWQHTAHLFTSSRLHTLLIECSWPAGRPTAQLFGHLGVEQLRKEMAVLALEVAKIRQRQNTESGPIETGAPVPVVKTVATRTRRAHTMSPPPITRGLKRKATPPKLPSPPIPESPLAGLRVVIIHCKEPAPGFDLAGAKDIADYIVRQLKDGVPNNPELGPDELGIQYIAAHQGDEFVL